MLVTFWAMSNRQMFDNKIGEISTFGEITYSYHLLGQSNPTFDHTSLLWFGGLVILIGICIILIKEVYLAFVTDNKVVKFIPSFFKALTKSDCEEMI